MNKWIILLLSIALAVSVYFNVKSSRWMNEGRKILLAQDERIQSIEQAVNQEQQKAISTQNQSTPSTPTPVPSSLLKQEREKLSLLESKMATLRNRGVDQTAVQQINREIIELKRELYTDQQTYQTMSNQMKNLGNAQAQNETQQDNLNRIKQNDQFDQQITSIRAQIRADENQLHQFRVNRLDQLIPLDQIRGLQEKIIKEKDALAVIQAQRKQYNLDWKLQRQAAEQNKNLSNAASQADYQDLKNKIDADTARLNVLNQDLKAAKSAIAIPANDITRAENQYQEQWNKVQALEKTLK